jgi:hypothetical protein
MSTREIENRLTAIEQEIAHLRAQSVPPIKAHPIHALEKIHGTFENDEAFREAMLLGRKWRQSRCARARKSK